MTVTAEPGIVSFGPSEVPKYKRVPIEFRYIRGEKIETQQFWLVAKTMDIGAANRVMRLLGTASSDEAADAKALLAMISLISKFMDDSDGTGATWVPVELKPRASDTPDSPKRFRGPDGRPHPWDKAESFLDLAKGSSRRRWLHLMNEDEDASVEIDDLTQLLQFLMELAGKGRGRA